MSYIGTYKMGKMYCGTTAIGKAYVGSDLVFDGSGGAPVILPYDAEIEFLQSSGSQYIDTGISPTTDFECEVKAILTTHTNSFETLLGSLDNSVYGTALGFLKNGGYPYIEFGETNTSVSVSPLSLRIYKSSLKNGVLKMNADGTSTTTNHKGGVPNKSLYLFCRHNGNSATNFVSAKVYYCKIWNGGNLVFDAIPVRVGQVGQLYDRISGQLFGNAGSGSFTLGNDKQ